MKTSGSSDFDFADILSSRGTINVGDVSEGDEGGEKFFLI